MPRLLAAVAVATVVLAGAVDAHAADLGQSCKSDADCPLGSICDNANVCTALPKKKTVIPFYFHQPGDSGYRHIIPLGYFHTWDKHDDTRVQFPLFGWHRDHDTHETTTVIPLLFSSYTTSPTAKLFRNGRSQAVRLPKAFRFEGEEVSIRREGKRVILEPLPRQRWPKGYWKSWGRYLKHLEEVEPLPAGGRTIDLDDR